ncbi:MAG: ATP-binding protein [Flavobacteriales bacterium]
MSKAIDFLVNGFFLAYFFYFSGMNYVFTGPESSGKTTLANELCNYLNNLNVNAFVVSEAARDYLSNLGREYYVADLLEIAKLQYESERKAKNLHKDWVCMDTDLITIKIWSEFKYGSCDQWILDRLDSNKDALYVLCYPDIPWEEDVLRENPNDREELFELYLKTLQDLKLNFVITRGNLEQRIKKLTTI